MKRLISVLSLMALVAVCASNAAAVKTASLSLATDFVGPDSITSATLAAASGEQVNVTQAGTYKSVILRGNKNHLLSATVPGVVIFTTGTAALVTSGTQTGVTTAVVTGFRIEGAGAAASSRAVLINQASSRATTLTLTNCAVVQSNTANAANKEALAFSVVGSTGSASAGLIATNCTFDALTTNGGGNVNAIQINGATPLSGFNGRFTNCTIHSVSGAPVSTLAGTATNNQNWSFTKSTLIADFQAGRRRGFTTGQNHNGCTFSFTDSIVKVPGEALFVGNTGNNNKWILTRSTFDNRRFGFSTTANGNLRLRYNTSTATPHNRVDVLNCLILTHPGTNSIELGGNTGMNVLYSTLAHEGGAVTGTGVSRQNNGMTTQTQVVNTLFYNVGSPLNNAGPWMTIEGNVVASPTASTGDSDLGVVGVDYTTTTLAALNLIHFIPQSTSPTSVLIGAARTSSAIIAAVGFVDRNGAARSPLPADVGAFESNAIGVPVELSSFQID